MLFYICIFDGCPTPDYGMIVCLFVEGIWASYNFVADCTFLNVVRGTVSVISSDLSCKEDNPRFTTVPLKSYSDQSVYLCQFLIAFYTHETCAEKHRVLVRT